MWTHEVYTFTSEFDAKVQAAGGMDEYYKLSQKDELEAHKHALAEIDPSIDPASDPFNRIGYHTAWIKHIENLFSVYDSLSQAGVEVSFIGLTHTMQQFATSVLLPMKELLDQGSVDDAVALYKQPRHYLR